MRIACVAAALMVVAGCAATEPRPAGEPQPADASPLISCTDPRPQLCTMEFAPVCAELNRGGQREYASGCNACADAEVTGYRPGPCPE